MSQNQSISNTSPNERRSLSNTRVTSTTAAAAASTIQKPRKDATVKELSSETLMIGGLVRRPQSVMRRNTSALSKEYHMRHTRHIQGATKQHDRLQQSWMGPASSEQEVKSRLKANNGR